MYCEDCMLHGNLEVKAWPNLKTRISMEKSPMHVFMA